LCDLYRKVENPKAATARHRELDFYRNLLIGFKKNDLIFDIGANEGYKTSLFLSLGARVVAVEPDDFSQAILTERFLKYRFKPKPVSLVAKAVSDKEKIETMWVDKPGSALNTLSQKWVDALKIDRERFGRCMDFAQRKLVQTITLDDLFVKYGLPVFVKVDVEGHELSVLRGMSHAVPYLSFEMNLPEFRQEGSQCVELLQELAADGQFNYVVDCRGDGLVMRDWLSAPEFLRVLGQCKDSSVEVFWRTTHRRRESTQAMLVRSKTP